MVNEPASSADVTVMAPPEGDDDSEVGAEMDAAFAEISGNPPAPVDGAVPPVPAADGEAIKPPASPAPVPAQGAPAPAEGTPAAPVVPPAPPAEPPKPKTAMEQAEALAADAEAAEQWWAPILAAHPDAFDIADDPKFKEWVKANNKDVTEKASPAEVIAHVSAFKLQRGPVNAAPAAPAPAVTPAPAVAPVPPAAPATGDDFLAGLKFKTKDGRELTWDEYHEQFAEIADAQEAGLRALADLLSKRTGSSPSALPPGPDIQALRRALVEQSQQMAELRAQLDLLGVHADALQVLKSDGYRAWLPKQSPRVQKLATFRDAESQSKILLAYKESLVEAERQKAAEAGLQDRNRQKTLHGSSLQSGAQRPVAGSKESDFDGAWNEATGKK